jgi:hypothetical protein
VPVTRRTPPRPTAGRSAGTSTGGVDAEGLYLAAEEHFADAIAAGRVPGIRQIKATLKVGQPKAMQVREYLSTGMARPRPQRSQRSRLGTDVRPRPAGAAKAGIRT